MIVSEACTINVLVALALALASAISCDNKCKIIPFCVASE